MLKLILEALERVATELAALHYKVRTIKNEVLELMRPDKEKDAGTS